MPSVRALHWFSGKRVQRPWKSPVEWRALPGEGRPGSRLRAPDPGFGSPAASLRKRGLWLQQLHSPVVHLHNGCLFIHYANGMGGKLGNKGRRKEKIALACFNILFISRHFGLQKAEPSSAAVSGNSLWAFSEKQTLFFFNFFRVYFVEPSEQHNTERRKRSELRLLFLASGLSSSILIFGKTKIENNIY